MRGLRKPWCDQDDATLKSMWLAGETGVAIGLALGGRGEEGVRKRAAELGLEKRRAGRKFLDGLPKSPRRPAPRPRVGVRKIKAFFAEPFDPIVFVDKRRNQCAFIAGDACGPETMCCGRPTVGAGSWCEGHRNSCTIDASMSKLVRMG